MGLTTANLGNINNLSLREVWPGEQSHFTPWLSRNIDILGDAVGLEFECLDTELYAGDGKRRADMLVEMNGRELAVVENQYGKANGDHGWRTLHYALSLGAKAAFWIFEDISSDDEKLISFLNKHSEISIIGIQAKVYQIDDSLPALTLRVIPSSEEALAEILQKSKTSRDITPKEEFYGDFFPTMMAEVYGSSPFLGKGGYSNTRGHWNYYCSWNSALGCRNPWEAAFSQRRGSDGSYYIHLMLRDEDAKQNFQYLRSCSDKLFDGVSTQFIPDWDFDPNRKSQKIKFVYPSKVDVDTMTHKEAKSLIEWTCTILPQLQKNLSNIISSRDNVANLKVASSS